MGPLTTEKASTASSLPNYRIVVIGASAGGFDALKIIAAALPADLNAAVFVVWHISPDVKGVLPQVLGKYNLKSAHAKNGEAIEPGNIYIAPPDHHLVVEAASMRITRGPKENRFRPAADPLFRSAAYTFGHRVIGVILSGALDDGAAGLWAVKNRGGITIVQDPADADVPSMPAKAIEAAETDYIVPARSIGKLLSELCALPLPPATKTPAEENNMTQKEIRIALQDSALEQGIMDIGELSPYACPECHGVLVGLKEGHRVRFRCHTGHAYSADSLLAAITEKIEDSLWNAVRGAEESVLLLNQLGDHFSETDAKLAASYFKNANEVSGRIKTMRHALLGVPKIG